MDANYTENEKKLLHLIIQQSVDYMLLENSKHPNLEHMDTVYTRELQVFSCKPLEDMPLYINHKHLSNIAKWRLQIGH